MQTIPHIRSRADLPNVEGFKFIALLKDGTLQVDTVKKNANGQHYCDTFSQMVGWSKYWASIND